MGGVPVESEDGDVVLLAVAVGGGGEFGGGEAAEGEGAAEAEELAGVGAGFDDAVGDEGEACAVGQEEGLLVVLRLFNEGRGAGPIRWRPPRH